MITVKQLLAEAADAGLEVYFVGEATGRRYKIRRSTEIENDGLVYGCELLDIHTSNIHEPATRRQLVTEHSGYQKQPVSDWLVKAGLAGEAVMGNFDNVEILYGYLQGRTIQSRPRGDDTVEWFDDYAPQFDFMNEDYRVIG